MNKLEKIILNLTATTVIALNSGCITLPQNQLNNDSQRKIEPYEAKNSSNEEWTPLIYGFGGIW